MNHAGMMTIHKTLVGQWVSQLLKQATVFAPTVDGGGDEVFSRVAAPEEVAWKFINPLSPPKQFILPQTEPIVAINRRTEGYSVEPIYDERRRIVFNLRSCDVRGIAFLTKMHASDLPEDNYLKRIERTILISLSCNRPCPKGFCICFDAGPFCTETMTSSSPISAIAFSPSPGQPPDRSCSLKRSRYFALRPRARSHSDTTWK